VALKHNMAAMAHKARQKVDFMPGAIAVWSDEFGRVLSVNAPARAETAFSNMI